MKQKGWNFMIVTGNWIYKLIWRLKYTYCMMYTCVWWRWSDLKYSWFNSGVAINDLDSVFDEDPFFCVFEEISNWN